MNKMTAILIAGLFSCASSIAQTTVTTTTVNTPTGAVVATDVKSPTTVVKADAAVAKPAAKPKARKRIKRTKRTHVHTGKKTTTYSLKVPKKVTVTTE